MAANAALWPHICDLANHVVPVNVVIATTTVIAAPGPGNRIVVVNIVGGASGRLIFKSGAGGAIIFNTRTTAARPISWSNPEGIFNCDTNALLQLVTDVEATILLNYKIVDDDTYVLP